MKNILRFLFFAFLVYSTLTILIGLLKTKAPIVMECLDQYVKINDQNDRLHQRSWDSYDYSESYCTSYQSFEYQSLEVGGRRNNMIVEAFNYENLWGTVYRNLIDDSKSYIDFIVDSLSMVSIERNLSRSALADLIVTFVQDIPYSYVRSEACNKSDNQGKPCVGNVALGILSPYEFLHSLYGDCDTRAVLIYTILEELGYDPMIVVSNEYAHAMLALNTRGTGDHLKYKGKNYYFWETTAKGWPMGMLPPNTNNINYWKIALVNER